MIFFNENKHNVYSVTSPWGVFLLFFYKKVINKNQTHVAFKITFTHGIHHEPHT